MVRQRIARGLILIAAAVVLAAGSTLAYPHIAGLIYYKPRLDRLFEWRRSIIGVQLIQIDVIRAQPA